MSRYHLKHVDLYSFTEDTPDCPKCGCSRVNRIYQDRARPVDVFWPDVDHEFLLLTCQECYYQWGQHTRGTKAKNT